MPDSDAHNEGGGDWWWGPAGMSVVSFSVLGCIEGDCEAVLGAECVRAVSFGAV
ncbi:hypothetical protein F4561_005922 [Lipingzhangella halophila]|uniref:Uncharacterized protein n=1 Tax=Lipingzhangella halophila TaxID=1783352 RepID=A0A7W7RN24_9ACTN|nr:hypothetical protein [Lipingzhangella halophila]MBB4935028.1 hypothetical protein [Lipingzhangella halophila]